MFETRAWRDDLRWKTVERTAVVCVPAAILEAAKVRVVHQTNIAGLRTLDNDDVTFFKVLALVYELHRLLRHGLRQSAER